MGFIRIPLHHHTYLFNQVVGAGPNRAVVPQNGNFTILTVN